MALSKRTLREWLILTTLVALIAGTAAWQGWLWRADLLIYDLGLALNSRPPPQDIVVIAIDDESLARIGHWPWRRAVHATLIDALTSADAAAVGIDIIFSEPNNDDVEGDRVLAESIARNGRVILPVVQKSLGPGMLSEGLPAPIFVQAAADLGHIDIEFDADAIVRSVYLWAGQDLPRYPQLTLAMLRLVDPMVLERYPSIEDGKQAPPGSWRRQGWLHLPFSGPPGTYRTVSYVDVLSGIVGPEQLKGKLVLVGATAPGLGDVYPTPVAGLNRAMPGVELHATVLDTLRSNNAVSWVPRANVVLVVGIAVLLLMMTLLYLSPADGLLLSAAFGAIALISVILLLHTQHLWFPPSGLIIGTALAYPLWSWRRLEAAQRFLDFELQALNNNTGEPATRKKPEPIHGPLENRIAIVRAAALRQRAHQKAREDTMRFVSHDLRAPLSSIITMAEAAVTDNSDATARLIRAGHYAQTALDLVDEFFRLAKAEAVDPTTFTEVDLLSLAEEAMDEVWVLAEGKNVRISIDNQCAPEATVLGDRSLLRRALANLINNAIKYGPHDTTVKIELKDREGHREILIIDHGEGIAAENIPKLFTRYARFHNPNDPTAKGIGLGLVIVKTVIERHGGTIDVASQVGVGSTFRIQLPRPPSGRP